MAITIKSLNQTLSGDPDGVYDKCYIADTEAERDSIIAPLTDHVCFVNDTSRFYARISSVWVPLALQGESMVELRTSDPASPETGQLWLRTDL